MNAKKHDISIHPSRANGFWDYHKRISCPYGSVCFTCVILFMFSLPFWIPPESTNAIYKHSNTTLGTSNDTSIFVMNRILCFWNGNDYARRARLKSQKSIQWDQMKWISTNHFQMVYFYRLLGVSVFTFDSVDRYQTSQKACFWFWWACYSIYRHHGLFSLCVLQTLALL